MIWARVELADGTITTGVVSEDGMLEPRAALGATEATGAPVAMAQARLLAPVVPGKFFGLWNNFHASTQRNGWTIPQHPLYFLKSSASLADPEAEVEIGPDTGRVIFEGELAIVIGRHCHRADAETAAAAILGYTCVNDLTAIDILNADPAFAQWTRAKGLPGFGPLGPVIVTDLDWRAASVRTLVGGRERQAYPLSDMILPPAEIVRLISQDMPLEAGDVIACGTSIGARPVKAGDRVEVVIDGIGSLGITMTAAPTPEG